MKRFILLFIFFGLISFDVFAQDIGTIKEVNALDIDVEARWMTNFHYSGQYNFQQRYVQRTFNYTPPEGWVITSYRLAHKHSRSGDAEVIFEEGEQNLLQRTTLNNVYTRLLALSENLTDNRDLKDRIKEDYESHKNLLDFLKTDHNQMVVFVQVESHGSTPSSRRMASSNRGVFKASVVVEMTYVGINNEVEMFNFKAQKYGLSEIAGL